LRNDRVIPEREQRAQRGEAGFVVDRRCGSGGDFLQLTGKVRQLERCGKLRDAGDPPCARRKRDDPRLEAGNRDPCPGGGVVAIDLVGGEREVEKLFNSLRLVRTAPSLGGVETLASYPMYSSHAGFSDEQLKAAGVSQATVRFALGIETAADIIADVTQSLSVI